MHYGAITRFSHLHEYRQAHHAFPAYESNFERRPVFNSSEQGHNATSGKIDILDESSFFVEDFFEKQRDFFQAREKAFVDFSREFCK